MKFQHLPIGARFDFEGKHYTKTSPLVASEDGGGQRMIARYAVLQVLHEATGKIPDLTDGQLGIAYVLNAFADYESSVLQLLQQPNYLAPEHIISVQQAITELGQAFRGQLKSE